MIVSNHTANSDGPFRDKEGSRSKRSVSGGSNADPEGQSSHLLMKLAFPSNPPEALPFLLGELRLEVYLHPMARAVRYVGGGTGRMQWSLRVSLMAMLQNMRGMITLPCRFNNIL